MTAPAGWLTVPDALLIKLNDEYVSIEDDGLHSYNSADPVYGSKYTLNTLELLGFDIHADTGKLLGISHNANGE